MSTLTNNEPLTIIRFSCPGNASMSIYRGNASALVDPIHSFFKVGGKKASKRTIKAALNNLDSVIECDDLYVELEYNVSILG